MKIKAGGRIVIIQGGQPMPFAKPLVEEPCPAGEHVERIYFPEVDPEEMHPLKRLEKLREAGADSFEVVAAEHNIRAGHITHGRQISRPATKAELGGCLLQGPRVEERQPVARDLASWRLQGHLRPIPLKTCRGAIRHEHS